MPVDGDKPWGSTVRSAVFDVSDRADTALTNASSALSTASSALSTATTANSSATANSTAITALQTAVSAKADDSVVVKLTGAQTIAGVKTFSSAPAVPDASFAISKVNGLQAALDSKLSSGSVVATTGDQSIAGIKTFTSAPVVPDNSFAISKITNLQTTLNNLQAGALADGSVTNVKIASNAAISADKLANGTTNVIMTAAERTKLSGIATGATANDTDANLKNLANATGTLPLANMDTRVGLFVPYTLTDRPTIPSGMQLVVIGGNAPVSWLLAGDLQLMTP